MMHISPKITFLSTIGNFSVKFGVFEGSPLAVRLCIFLKIRIILVKMVLSIVFVFLSAEDFPIFKNFLFSKINRSLSNIFKSMNRLLSLPTKIQIKNKNKKIVQTMPNFWSKVFIFSVENGLFGSENDLFGPKIGPFH